MPTFLFRVDRVSAFAGFICPSPGASPAVRGVEVGAAVELLRPDGTRLKTRIASVPIIDPWVPDRLVKIAFRDIALEDVPLGTEVWLQDSPAPA